MDKRLHTEGDHPACISGIISNNWSCWLASAGGCGGGGGGGGGTNSVISGIISNNWSCWLASL